MAKTSKMIRATFGGEQSLMPDATDDQDDIPIEPFNDPEKLRVHLGDDPIAPDDDGTQYMPTASGGMMIDLGGEGGALEGDYLGQPGDGEHGANLAEGMKESVLNMIAQDIEEWVDIDTESRKPWHDKLTEGLKLLGVLNDDVGTGPFKLANKVNHPMIGEACVQFQARAMAEMLPPTGPSKGSVLGDSTPELEAQSNRVADYQNYTLMVDDTDFYPETDKMLFVMGYEGSQFKKLYKDPILGKPVSRWVRGENFLVPYGSSSLEQALRYTHMQEMYHNDLVKLQAGGFYIKADVPEPPRMMRSTTELREAKDRAQGQVDSSSLDADVPHTLMECHCTYDLPGFEDVDEEGNPTGIELPYIITVERESKRVLAIRRNWKEDDQRRNKIISFVHFPYIPGDGFYSYGLIHLIGGLAHATNGLLRIILIGGAFASMQGGFVTKSGGKHPAQVEIEWGVYKEIDATYEELAKMFYTPSFKEPNEALHKVLGLLIEAGQRFSSTTENMVGDANNTGPVGTTVALIEQGSKVHTAIHKRLHYAQGKELKLHMELLGEWMAEDENSQGYPYHIAGKSGQVALQDFDKRVDVIPVSDPNIFSTTQRIALAQAIAQRSDLHPGLYVGAEVERTFLMSMRVSDDIIDRVLAKPAKIGRNDPVTENSMMVMGRGAKAFEDQDHESHMVVHQFMIDTMMAKGPGDPIGQKVLPYLLAHQGEHIALGTRVKLASMMGIQLPPMPDPTADETQAPQQQQLPPEIEHQMAQAAAQAVMKMPRPQVPGAGDQQAKQAQQQMEAMQKEAKALEMLRQKAKDAKNDVDKARLQLEAENREAVLRAQIIEMRTAMERAEITRERQEIDRNVGHAHKDALREIESLIDKRDQQAQAAAETP